MVSRSMKQRRAQVGGTLCVVTPSSWGYSTQTHPVSVQKTLLIQPRVLNTSKQQKAFFSNVCPQPHPSFFCKKMDAAQTHLAPYYIYICMRGPNMCMGSFKMCLVTTGQILDGQMGSHGKKNQALSFLPLLFSFIVN